MKEIKTGNSSEGIQKVNTGQPMMGEDKVCALIETMITHPGISYNDAIKITISPMDNKCPFSHDPKLNTGHICTNCGFDMLSKTYPEKKELSAEDVNNLFADRNKAWDAWDKFRVSDRYYPEAVANIFLAGWDANDSLVKTYTKALRNIEKYKDDRSAAWAIGHIKNIASEALSLSHKEDTEAVEFAEWIASQEWLILCDGEWYYEDDKDGDQPIKEARLYETFLRDKLNALVKEHTELHDNINNNRTI